MPEIYLNLKVFLPFLVFIFKSEHFRRYKRFLVLQPVITTEYHGPLDVIIAGFYCIRLSAKMEAKRIYLQRFGSNMHAAIRLN